MEPQRCLITFTSSGPKQRMCARTTAAHFVAVDTGTSSQTASSPQFPPLPPSLKAFHFSSLPTSRCFTHARKLQWHPISQFRKQSCSKAKWKTMSATVVELIVLVRGPCCLSRFVPIGHLLVEYWQESNGMSHCRKDWQVQPTKKNGKIEFTLFKFCLSKT